MAPLSHPSIQDGWFREISSQWPGQAMTLKVNKILHVEKSRYQDVLVFESETYGNVLVLDGVIQCTERDEFSYQEMIAHLPLATHPNPRKVLVLKHKSVEEVVLCDIDEVSKTYLPHMSALLESPKVTVFVGDGFQFLADNEAAYDVIITDSSDPVGPAESLFQKPYFQLLYDALLPGGHISTQGECLWLHLPLISQLRDMTAEIFPVTQYAYTTIPTYPSGQIGFMVCSKDPSRNLSEPLRQVPETRYYNENIHRYSQNPSSGSGFVARPCAEYIIRDPTNELTIACRTLSTISLDVNSTEALDAQVAAHDLVISLIPYTYHAAVIKSAIKGKTHVELDEEAKRAGIVVMNEIGLDPGIDHLYAVKTISEVHEKGGKIKQFLSYCGGLPAPECSGNPLGYKFSWSSPQVDITGSDLMGYANPYFISPAYAFVAYPNRNSVPFREFYDIPEAETIVRGTLRYQGFPEFIKVLVDLGWLDATEKEWLTEDLTWAEVDPESHRCYDASEKLSASSPNESESTRIISGTSKPRGKNLLDTLCAQLETLDEHKFVVEWQDGTQQILTSTLEKYGSPGGHSAMAVTVGVPCGIATQLVLDGVINTPGVLAPYTKEICEPIRALWRAKDWVL
ncbi:Spermine/spermidine synthase-domain-containing protein [Pisolithus marmoratus]|nr:Spermine/spermidine synthase-domain-containing protein [Pisolithus marmoratus]